MYDGPSDSFGDLQESYFTYAKTVNTSRAFPDVRDGLKPVHRRILQAAHKRKLTSWVKSSSLVGSTMERHQFGDGSIYSAMLLMTDSNESWGVPLLRGNGNTGKVYNAVEAASMRYTEVSLGPWANDLLEDIDFVEKVPTMDETGMEASVLPSRYPFILTVGHKGMGVGMSTFIPPFNFWDILNLTYLYLTEGEFDNTYIYPDFSTGGEIVADPVSAIKMMHTGKGQYTVRAKYEIQKRAIVVTQLPPDLTTKSFKRKVDDLNHPNIVSVAELDDLKKGCRVTIFCRSAAVVEEVEADLFRRSLLQRTFTPFMLWSIGGEMREGGVYSMIEEWVKFRRTVVEARLQAIEKTLVTDIERLRYFIELVANTLHRDAYIDRVVNKNSRVAADYLSEIFPGDDNLPAIPKDVVEWIYGRRVAAFNEVNSYSERFAKLSDELNTVREQLNDIDGVIIDDLESLAEEHKGHHDRKSQLTSLVVSAAKSAPGKAAKSEVNESCYLHWNQVTGLITKSKLPLVDKSVRSFSGGSLNTLLLGITAESNLAKIWASDLEWDVPTSISNLCKLDGDHVVYVVPSTSPDKVFVFSTGELSFWSPGAEYSARRTKSRKKVFPALDYLLTILDEDATDSVTWGYVDTRSGEPMVTTTLIQTMDRPKQSMTAKAQHPLHQYAEYYGTNVEMFERPLGVLTTGDDDPDWDAVLTPISDSQ